jgi:hypothetical protein
VAAVLGRGKLARIEVALSNWLVELGGYQVKLLGEQLRKEVPCGLDIRAAKFVSRRSGFPIKQQNVAVGINEVRAGERALKAERAKKLKPAKTAGERGSRGEGNWREGNSPAWRRGGTKWRLT